MPYYIHIYGYERPRFLLHSWPGANTNWGTHKHNAARKARFKARHRK